MKEHTDDINRVKYYSAADMTCGYYLERAEKVIGQYNNQMDYNDVNQVIEFYNIKSFFEKDISLCRWGQEEIKKYKEIVISFSKKIGIFWSNIDESNLIEELEKTEINYIDDFWILVDSYKVYERLTSQCFYDVSHHKKFRITDVLLNKNIVKYFGDEIREYILHESYCATLLLDKYAAMRENKNKHYYFPSELMIADREKILINYINDEYANPNYLKLIYESQSTKELPISDKTKLLAKRRYQEKVDKLFENSLGISYGVQVIFSMNQTEEKFIEYKNRDFIASYSSSWISDNFEYPTLLNNFIYLFEFVDLQFRILHVNKLNQIGIIERMLGVKGKKEYFTGTSFYQLQNLAMLQTIGYYAELKRNGVRLESVLEWFFKIYLKDEFNAEGFILNLPSENATFLEKCRSIVSEIDSILKQFRLYVEDDIVDHELLQLSSEHMLFRDIPSFLNNKYIYPRGDEYQTASYYMFSDQSVLHYIVGLEHRYNSFIDLIRNEKVNKENFEHYQVNELDWLFKHDYILYNDQGFIILNENRVRFLKELYDNEVINSYYVKKYNDVIFNMEKQELIEYGSSLFSKPEQDYFNYLLNKAEFSNGLDLRNRYVHGTQTSDEKEHKQDYFTFLRILILIVIKINNEFCLADEEGLLKHNRDNKLLEI
jgi:hypothetical protein